MASFHPVTDRPYRYDTVETRTADGVVRTFRASRTVLFHRTAAGYDVTVTLGAIDEHAGGDVGRMFMAATGALLRKPLRYRLDASGTVLDIADADATIALIADAIERMSAQRDRRGDAHILASPLRTLPPERKAAMLRSILAPLIAGPTAERAVGPRATSVPSRPPLAPGSALAGIETLSRSADGVVTIDVRADGGVDAAAPPETHGHDIATPAHSPPTTIHTIRNIDSATGLVIDARDTIDTRLSDGTTIHTTRIDTVVILHLVP